MWSVNEKQKVSIVVVNSCKRGGEIFIFQKGILEKNIFWIFFFYFLGPLFYRKGRVFFAALKTKTQIFLEKYATEFTQSTWGLLKSGP